MLGCYMYGRFLDRKGSGQTDQGEPRFSPTMAAVAAWPAIHQSWRVGSVSPRGPGAMDGDSACRWGGPSTARHPSEAGIGLTGDVDFTCRQYPNRLGYVHGQENGGIECRERAGQAKLQGEAGALRHRASSGDRPRKRQTRRASEGNREEAVGKQKAAKKGGK